MLADMELACVVGDNDGVLEQALMADRTPQRPFAGNQDGAGCDLQIRKAKRASSAPMGLGDEKIGRCLWPASLSMTICDKPRPRSPDGHDSQGSTAEVLVARRNKSPRPKFGNATDALSHIGAKRISIALLAVRDWPPMKDWPVSVRLASFPSSLAALFIVVLGCLLLILIAAGAFAFFTGRDWNSVD
jgi:hypothetical protein